MDSWHEFFEADTLDLGSLPRRILKSGAKDVKQNVSKNVKFFCDKNFESMTEAKLDLLYEEIKSFRGIEIPLAEFETKYSKIHKSVLKSAPPHCTVVISLWGLQFKFPEDFLAKDLLQALTVAIDADTELERFRKVSHATTRTNQDAIFPLIRKKEQALRSCILTCFILIEAHLNGIAWDFVQHADALDKLSQKDRDRIRDNGRTSLREKILNYPRIVTSRPLWNGTDEPVKSFLNNFKPFRDSLVHPSPFSAPEKFGGYDKLRYFYNIDLDIAVSACENICDIIMRVHKHLNSSDTTPPIWLADIQAKLDEQGLKKSGRTNTQ
ncbi:MAG: hypothetical protein KQJ78_10420 [Deltaproteobacteria bacterium]|nr:hypothetical protein [Deltaproteobacteria bacterium]